jgi:UTP--glucose-1-phosphate uridylyltransferase
MPHVTAPVVIPAAGRGSRLDRLTRFASKELLPLGDNLALSHILAEIQDAGVEDVLIVSRPDKPDIDAYVAHMTEEGRFDLRIRLLYQGDIPGNGDAVLTAAAEIGPRPFVVIWGDEVFLGPSRLGQLVKAYEELGAPCICLRPVREEDVPRCGIAEAEPDENGRLRIRRILEKPAPTATASRMASVGRSRRSRPGTGVPGSHPALRTAVDRVSE